ncbi:Ribonuclease H [Abeliophyllum distichum]|uniref:Ribonuclease H n=1 Tax=Abeliophyllum distichum TaxID=126358 RepID=A0ABD1Q5Y5_9LAMI
MAHKQSMIAYLKKAKDFLSHFKKLELFQISRVENGYADVLSKLASYDFDLMKAIPVEKLSQLTIDEVLQHNAMIISEFSKWVKKIVTYLIDQVLPNNDDEVTKFVL